MNAETGQFVVGGALCVSLALHLSAFGLVRTIRDWRDTAVTESTLPDPQAEPEPDEASAPPEEEEFKPGIEKGAPAVVTWIGYEEYEEHLARLGESDQAAFTSAIARGIPESTSDAESPAEHTPSAASPPMSPPPVEFMATIIEPPVEAAKVDEPQTAQAAPPAPEIAEVEPPVESAPIESIEVPQEPAERVIPEPLETEPKETEPAGATPTEQPADRPIPTEERDEPAKVEPAPQEPAPRQDPKLEPAPQADPSLLPTTVPTPLPGMAPTPVSMPHGEPVAKDSEHSEKDAAATSVREVPEVKWDNGKPLAAEGMELRPYSLFRHISWDSRDIMFAQQLNRGSWEGRVKRNPIVSMRFDRHGRVGEVRIIRPSGYAPLDELYLKSWIARWTAADKRLAALRVDELTTPIQMKIVFIEEPPKAAGGDADPNEGS